MVGQIWVKNLTFRGSLFPSRTCSFVKPIVFAKHIINLSEEEYTCIAANKWYCAKKKEYVEVQDL